MAGTVIAVALSPLLGAGLLVGGVYVTHPRDEDRFLSDVRDFAQESGEAETLPAREELLAQGDRACAWLRAQPLAFWHSGPRFRHITVWNRYTDEHLTPGTAANEASLLVWVGDPAWRDLCPASLTFHTSHGLGLHVASSD